MPPKPSILLAVAGVAAASAVAAAPAGAQTPADIEGVWSFNGGQVAVQPLPDGTFQGTIIRETKLSHCPHELGERMWVGVRPVGDGSLVGGHQWFDPATCAPRTVRGNSAFRVLTMQDGSRFVRACLSPPERPIEQPAITPDGTATPPGVDCHDSALVAPLRTKAPAIRSIARLPRATKRRNCRPRRSLTIRLREPRGDALASVEIFLDGKRIRKLTGQQIVDDPVRFKGRKQGRYKVELRATTVLGHTITGARKYRTCSPKQPRRLKRRG